MNIDSVNYFELLPTEVVEYIFYKLEGKDLINCQFVCRKFNELLCIKSSSEKLRIKKYVFILQQIPNFHFKSGQEAVAWAISEMKKRELLTQKGMRALNHNFFQAKCGIVIDLSEGMRFYFPVWRETGCVEMKEDKEANNAKAILIRSNDGTILRVVVSSLSRNLSVELRGLTVPTNPWRNEKVPYWYQELKESVPSNKIEECTSLQPITIGHCKEQKYKGKDGTLVIFSNTEACCYMECGDFRNKLWSLKSVEDSTEGLQFILHSPDCEYALTVRRDAIEQWKAEERAIRSLVPIRPPIEKQSEENGFTIGGENSQDVLQGLTAIGGRPIAHIEADLRKKGFLGQRESLLQRMVYDQGKTEEIGLTHDEIASPYLEWMHQFTKHKISKFQFNSEKYKLSQGLINRQPLFEVEELKLSSRPFSVCRKSDKKKLNLNYQLIDAIARYGFYGGLVSPDIKPIDYYGPGQLPNIGQQQTLSPRILASFLKRKDRDENPIPEKGPVKRRKLSEPDQESVPYKMTTKDGITITDYTDAITLNQDETDLYVFGKKISNLPKVSEAKSGIVIRWTSDNKVHLCYHLNEFTEYHCHI